MTPLERAARAILAVDYPEEAGGAIEDLYWDRRGEGYMAYARAVLQAIREPSEAMDRAAAECESSYVGDVYTAMIDAALGEGR